MRDVKITEQIVFAYATKGEALEVANQTEKDTEVWSIVIMSGGRIAEKAVAYLVAPAGISPK